MIKVGYLVSYDYSYLYLSINRIYDFVDKIYIAIDKDRLTWAGNKFEIPNSFFEKIKEIDYLKKIIFYKDKFYVLELTPMECETRERNLLLKKMGRGWLIQLDSDEYVVNIKELINYLKKHRYLNLICSLTPVVFQGTWITLFKQTKSGFLYIGGKEPFPLITNYPKVEDGRYNRKIVNFDSEIEVVHQSWARSEEEIMTKIQNWGHKNDFDTLHFFSFWKNLDEQNYKKVNNFHPLKDTNWSKLNYIESKESENFIDYYNNISKESYHYLNPFLYIYLLIKIKTNTFKNYIITFAMLLKNLMFK